VLYGDDSEVIARNPGLQRIEILIDHGGTPTDPDDDELGKAPTDRTGPVVMTSSRSAPR